MKNKFIKILKIFIIVQILVVSFNVFGKQVNKNQKTIKTQTQGEYAFRPLLIQGKKRLIQEAKDMKVESGGIVESQLFFVDIDFQKRIFINEVTQ